MVPSTDSLAYYSESYKSSKFAVDDVAVSFKFYVVQGLPHLQGPLAENLERKELNRWQG
jgi:hypothetical protein